MNLRKCRKIKELRAIKATWLLENGHIPCADTGKQTRRFTIKMKDIKEVLTTTEAAEVMLSKSITERIKCKDLKVYKYKARNIITKQNLLDSYFDMMQSNRSCYREFHMMTYAVL